MTRSDENRIDEYISAANDRLDHCDDAAAQVKASIALTLALTALAKAIENSAPDFNPLAQIATHRP